MNDKFRMIPDYKVSERVQILADIIDYNHKMMNIPHMWKDTRGSGIRLGVLDTGLPKHIDLRPVGSYSVIPGYLEDENGHSTHCAGIIAALANNGMGVAGIAPDIDDYYVAVLDGDGAGGIQGLIDGIRHGVDVMGLNIISMSLGIPATAPHIPGLEAACNYAVKQGCTIFAAAGNEASAVGQPAVYDSVIAIAAVNSKEQHASFSNTGHEVDFAAGGVNVHSTYLNNGYAKLSGTSFSCPAVAAVGALIQSKHLADTGKLLSPDELRAHIRKIAKDIGPDGFDKESGFGIPVFGKGEQVDPGPKPQPPQEDDDFKKLGPSNDCVYWRMTEDFLAQVKANLDNDSNLEAALIAGLKSLGRRSASVQKMLDQKINNRR